MQSSMQGSNAGSGCFKNKKYLVSILLPNSCGAGACGVISMPSFISPTRSSSSPVAFLFCHSDSSSRLFEPGGCVSRLLLNLSHRSTKDGEAK